MISSGRAIGLIMVNSANIEIIDTTVADFIQQGIWIQSSSSVTIDGAWVHHMIPEVDTIPAMDEYPIIEKYAFGGITATEGTSDITIRNTVVSGTWHHGFHFKPEECDENSHQVKSGSNSDFVFENNLAHSISGYGAIAANVENSCTIVRDFVAWKCTQSSIHLAGASPANVGRNLTSIDNRRGIGIHGGADGSAYLYDSKVYGDLELN